MTLWRQGDINIVVNTEQEGFAHSSYIVHGTGVCAIGLRVEDAEAADARAPSAARRSLPQAVGPGELDIPAIRGVGGSLIYFLDPKSELRASGRSSSTRPARPARTPAPA